MSSKTETIDTTHSKVSFSVKKLGFITVTGTISDFQGRILFNENDLGNSKFDVSISPITIDTGNAKRDEHLKSKDFFFAKEFPKISYHSTEIRKVGDEFIALGKLSLLNSTQEVSIPFSYDNRLLKGNFLINRLDFDLGKKFPSFIASKRVEVSINANIKEQ